MIFSGVSVGQIFTIKRILQSPKQMVFRRCKVQAIWWMCENFPTKRRQFISSHQRCVWPRIVMMKHDSLSLGQFWALFLDCFVQTVDLCTVQDRIDGFVTLQQLIMDNSLTLSNTLFFVNPGLEIICGGSSAFDRERLRLIFSYLTHF